MESEAINLKASPEHHLLFFGIFMKPKVINFMLFAMIFVLLLDILLQKQCASIGNIIVTFAEMWWGIREADLYFAFRCEMVTISQLPRTDLWFQQVQPINISHIFSLSFISHWERPCHLLSTLGQDVVPLGYGLSPSHSSLGTVKLGLTEDQCTLHYINFKILKMLDVFMEN